MKKYSHYFREVLDATRRVSLKRWQRIDTRLLVGIVIGLLASMWLTNTYLLQQYEDLESPAILDRNGTLLTLQPNEKQAYGRYSADFAPRAIALLIQKEDRFFYLHPGINPVSTVRAVGRYLIGQRPGGASTISQQLVKNLLGNEQRRSLLKKLIETFGAFSLELFNSKETIVTMYANSIYMGNQVQGLHAASMLYFGKRLEELDDTKLAMLLATISSPSIQNPWREENARASRNLAFRVGIEFDPTLALITQSHAYSPPRNFELTSMDVSCEQTCTTTIDADLTNRLRSMLNERVKDAWDSGARSGAIVVVKLPENEILSLVGTPDIRSFADGQQINMTLEPRAIGSTAKPFIYLQGFEKGLRPYTLVNDREYKFPIGSGFSLYPKNYDGTYRGWITLHSALSNSLNISSVKVLQYVGLTNFYDFLQNSLGFKPLKDFHDYQYGIALGALDMDPLTLAQYLTIFPQRGQLSPLKLFLHGTSSSAIHTPMSSLSDSKQVADPRFTELVTSVLSDRLTGVEQFGLASNLNLPQSNYAVKTGTSQDYHDSWTVGYTPDFLVVVWFGNPDNTPLKHITGQSGAGGVWHDTMETLMNSSYNKNTPFEFSHLRTFEVDGILDVGIEGDVVSEHKYLLPDENLITSPLEGDTMLFESGMSIPLVSTRAVSWYANDEFIGSGERVSFSPRTPGNYTLKATSGDQSHQLRIHITPRR